MVTMLNLKSFVERFEHHSPTGKATGIDVGLEFFYTDSDGNTVDNPRYLRKSEQLLNRDTKRVSRKQKGSKNRRKAINRLARKYLKISRQRKDFAGSTARALVQSSDLVAYEDLKVRNMVKNHWRRSPLTPQVIPPYCEAYALLRSVCFATAFGVPPKASRRGD